MESTKNNSTVVGLIKKGAIAGLGFGLAIATVHLAMGVILIMTLGMPPMTWFTGKTLFIEIPMAIAVGLLLCPVHLSKKGRFIQPAAMTVIWIALEFLVAVDPAKLQMWVAPALVALGLFFLFKWIWTKKPLAVIITCVVAPVIILSVPVVRYSIGGGYEVKTISNAKEAPADAPDVVFIVMDTVRAQNVSAYGYERKTTPKFDEFIKKGVLFEKAIAPSTWSLPAHGSLFTGALPSVTNAHGETRFLDDKLPTLAESIAKAGWETRCFTANTHISPGFGLTRGFGWTDNAWITGAGGRAFAFIYRLLDSLGVSAKDKGGSQVVSNVQDWMAQRPEDSGPAFIFVNFLEAHFPFHQLPPEFRNKYTNEPLSNLRKYGRVTFGVQMGRQLTKEEHNTIHQPIHDMYDGGILYTDYLMDQILDIWRKRGTLENTIVVILGDHGEHVGEHGSFGHTSSVYEQALWVPMMIYYPPKIEGGRRVEQEISTMGTFATIFDLLDLEAPDTLQVKSLMPALEPEIVGRKKPAFGRPVISERFEEKHLSSRFEPGTANGEGPLLSPWGRYRIYRIGNYKLVKHFEDGKFETYLFDLEKDPGEMKDLAKELPDQVEKLTRELESWKRHLSIPSLDGKVAPVSGGADSKLSDEAREQLKALGYIED